MVNGERGTAMNFNLHRKLCTVNRFDCIFPIKTYI